jgi:hypothetical protein
VPVQKEGTPLKSFGSCQMTMDPHKTAPPFSANAGEFEMNNNNDDIFASLDFEEVLENMAPMSNNSLFPSADLDTHIKGMIFWLIPSDLLI